MYNIIERLGQFDHLLTVDEVGEVLGLSRTSIYRLSESGQIPSVVLGGSRRFDPSTLALWISGKEPRIAKAHRQLRRETHVVE